MNIGNSFKLSRKMQQPDGSEVTEERSKNVDLDFAKLAIAVILAIIAYELARKGISVPILVWHLVEVVLILYIIVICVELAMVFYVGFAFRRD